MIFLNKENIRDDIMYNWPGIHYTLTLPMKIGPNLFKDQLFIGLNTNFIFKVFFHDLKYFLINNNPTTTPAAIRMFTTSAEKPNNWVYRLDLVEVNKLNHPSSPRVEDPSYSFISCLRRSVASKVQTCIIFSLYR